LCLDDLGQVGALQLWAGVIAAGAMLAMDDRAASSLQRADLRIDRLPIGG
jgi:hypothetical protein